MIKPNLRGNYFMTISEEEDDRLYSLTFVADADHNQLRARQAAATFFDTRMDPHHAFVEVEGLGRVTVYFARRGGDLIIRPDQFRSAYALMIWPGVPGKHPVASFEVIGMISRLAYKYKCRKRTYGEYERESVVYGNLMPPAKILEYRDWSKADAS